MQPSKLIFIGSALLGLLGLAFAAGLYSGAKRNVVFETIKNIAIDLRTVANDLTGAGDADLLYGQASTGDAITIAEGAALAPGLIMLVGAAEDDTRVVRVITRTGEVVQEWRPDWFKIWGSRGDFRKEIRPASRQPLVHGAKILPGGDLVFNFSFLSTIRMTPCGEVVWALENHGHHSVEFAEDGTLWVSGELVYDEIPAKYRNHSDGYRAYTLQNISQDGEILKEIDIYDILAANGLIGLAHLTTLHNEETEVTGDTLHANDVEALPAALAGAVFAPGDLLVSLRNTNAIFVADPETLEIKFLSVGKMMRQHDPDFIGGDRIVAYDNNNFDPAEPDGSRIVVFDGATGEMEVLVDGAGGETAFYSAIMGKQQILPDGGVLVTSSVEGRAFDASPSGEVRWSVVNRLADGKDGLLTEATLLPPEMDADFFKANRDACS